MGEIKILSINKEHIYENDVKSRYQKYFVILGLTLLLSIIFSGAVSANPLITNTSHSKVSNTQSKAFIDHVDPSNNSINVKSTKSIKIHFKTPIKRVNGWIQLKNNAGYIKITKNFKGNILTLNHSKPLLSGKYTLILHTGSVVTTDCHKLPLYISIFHVDNIPPRIISNYPFNGSKGYSRTSAFYIKFGENIKAGANYKLIRVKNLKNGKLIAVTKNIVNNTLFINSIGARNANNWYQVTIPSRAIKDLAGNNLKTVCSFKFKTGLKDLQLAPLNPLFMNYTRSISGFSDVSSSTTGSSILNSNIFPYTVFPANYDLRLLGRVSSVKDQNPLGTCWTFGTMGSLESCLLPYEIDDFSENNLKNNNGFDLIDRDNYGGTYDMSTAYLARWLGPVSESDDPYNIYSKVSTIYNPVKHVQNVLTLPARSDYSDNDNIKYAITNYGAVATDMCYDDSYSYYNSATDSYYYNSNSNQNHGVCIVGWDDNYNRYNFNIVPPGNGAFIVKNSWGTDWGQNGYFYVSYYDTKLGTDDNHPSGTSNFVFYNAEQPDNYNKNYQYDPLGWVSSVGYGSNTGWFSNIFTSTGNDTLSASSFYVHSASSTYELFAYLNPTNGNPASGTLMDHQTGNVMSGYHTITLKTPFILTTGDKFSIVVKLTTPGYNYPIPVEYAQYGYSNKARSGIGQSFASEDGSSWEDIYLTADPDMLNPNVCLKAFTTPDLRPNVINVDPDNNALISSSNKDIKVTFNEPVTLDSGTIELKNAAGTLVSITTGIAGNVLTIHPQTLADGTYTLTLHTNCVKNQVGYGLPIFTSSFSVDATQPILKSSDPASGSYTHPGKDIKITFNEPVYIGSGTVELKNTAGTLVHITTSTAENVLTIHPEYSLSNGIYTIILHQGSVTDKAGNLIASYTSKFTVDSSDPKVTGIDPVNNAVNINPDKIIKVTFSEPIILGKGTVDLENSSGIEKFALSISGKVLTIKPLKSLHNGIYSLFLYPGCVTDIAGNPLSTYASYFTVDSIAPTIISTSSGLYNTSKLITLTLSEPGRIYYTTNGTTPTISSKRYTSPFFITSTTTLKFFGKDLAGNPTPVYTRIYNIDKKAPRIVSTTPTNLKIQVSRTTCILIKFSENIRMSTYFKSISLKNLSTTKIVTITKSNAGNTTTIKSLTRLSPKTWYMVTVPSKAVKDMAGNNLAATYTFRFKTGA